MATASKKPRIVAVPLNAVGHVTPMMHLCSYLNSRHGFSITFVIVRGILSLKQMIEDRGTWPPPASDITLVQIGSSEPFPDSVIFKDGKLNLTQVHTATRAYAGDLENLVKNLVKEVGGVSAILSEYQYSWVIEVAEKLGIPGAIVFTGCSTWSWFDINLHHLVLEDMIPKAEAILSEEEDVAVCQDPFLTRSDIPWHFWDDKDLQEFTITYNVPTWDKAKWVLVNTCKPLEEEMVSVMEKRFGKEKYLAIGPLFLANEQRETVGLNVLDNKPLDWLDKQEDSSVLYIAFGSLAKFTTDQRHEFVLGLEASKQKFIWVVRSDEESGDYYRDLLESAEGRGMIVPWSPQVEVLSHSGVGAFLTHCGWNSTQEGIACGQPMICWPCLFDQNLNSKLIVEEWKIGTWLRKKADNTVVDRKEVERVIRLVMETKEGNAMRIRAKQLSRKVVHDIRDPNGISSLNLQAFADALSASSM